METNLCSFVWMVMCVFFCPTMKFVYSVVFLMFLMSWYMFSCISVYFLCRHREVVHVSKVLLCCLVFCFWFVIEALRKTDSDVEQLEYWYFHLLCLRPQNKACCEKKKKSCDGSISSEMLWAHTPPAERMSILLTKGPHVAVELRSWAFEKPNH